MQRREPLGALREIAHALRNVSSIDREPNPDVLKARIELYQRDLEREIHRNRDAIGFPPCRLSAILPTLCDAMGEELRELTPTTRYMNTATGETGTRAKSLSDADRLAHLQAYGEWLSTIIERFAGSREELRDYESKPLSWLSNRRAGKYPTESSSAIHEVESGLTGIRFAIEGTQPQAALDARTEPKPRSTKRKQGKGAKEALKLLDEWERCEQEEPGLSQGAFAMRKRIELPQLRNKLGYARRLREGGKA